MTALGNKQIMAENILYYMKRDSIDRYRLCEDLGFKYSTVCEWLSANKYPRIDSIEKMANYFGVPKSALIERKDEPSDKYSAYGAMPIKKQKIRLLGEIACGEPIFCDEDREGYIEADSDIIADFCLRAKGDSMTGARIMDGDIVFIREQPMVDDGEIAAVVVDDEATLKRVYYYRDENKLVLQAENPRYRPLVYVNEELDTIRILGKAVAFESKL